MKRVKSQYLVQVIHFTPNESTSNEDGVVSVDEELLEYKSKLEETAKIIKEEKLEDGSVLIKVKRRYPKKTK